jgi:uncharacterized membrane protein
MKRHPTNTALVDRASRGDRIADRVSSGLGSWRFIVIQTILVACWIGINVAVITLQWDPYPFIALNLAFSTQAAYAAPLLQLASNRLTQHAEHRADVDHTHMTESRAMLLGLIAAIEAAESIDQIRAVPWREILTATDNDDLT